MECINCGNCRQNRKTYYCFAVDGIVVNEKYVPENEKVRSGWKKGNPKYETHRRKMRKSDTELKGTGE